VADALLPLSPASPGGQIEDVESLVGALATIVVRQRIQVTGALLAEIARVMNIDPTGSEYALVTRNIQQRTATPPTIANVPAALGATLLLAANANRKMATFQAQEISSGGNLYLRLGPGPTTTLYHVLLVPGAYYELPQPVYTGDIWGIWDAAVGYVNVGEEV
jgi:hypothetical protein